MTYLLESHLLGAKVCNVFEPRAATGSERFSYLHTTFTSLSVFTTRDDYFENLGDNCPGMRNVNFRSPPVAPKRRYHE